MANNELSKNTEVAIILGSKSDWEIMKHCQETFEAFGVSTNASIFSAHRTPEALTRHLEKAHEFDVKIFIAAAGLAAHLAGVIASHTEKPVIGVPIAAGALNGVDALYSMVQMPPGIPVATVGIGKPGAVNAALLAVSILSLNDNNLAVKLSEYRKEQAEKVLSQQLE